MQLPTSVFLLFCTTVVLKYQGFREAWPSRPHPNQSCSLVASCFISSIFSLICPWPSGPFKEIILVCWSGQTWSFVRVRHCSDPPALPEGQLFIWGVPWNAQLLPSNPSVLGSLPEAGLELGTRHWGRHQAPGSRQSSCTDRHGP